MRRVKRCANCGNEVYKTRAHGTWVHRLTQSPTCFSLTLWKGVRVQVES